MVGKTSQSMKAQAEESSRFIALMKGVIYGYIITIPIFITFALILTYTDFPEKYISLVVMSTTIASILIAGSASAKGLKSKGWLNGGFVGLFYMLILYFLSSIVFKNFSINRYILTMGLIGILAGIIGGIVGVNYGAKTRTRKRRGK